MAVLTQYTNATDTQLRTHDGTGHGYAKHRGAKTNRWFQEIR